MPFILNPQMGHAFLHRLQGHANHHAMAGVKAHYIATTLGSSFSASGYRRTVSLVFILCFRNTS